MQDRPTARELVLVAAECIEREIVPALADGRLRFRARVAANLLNIVSREMMLEDAQLEAEWQGLRALLGDLPPLEGTSAGETPVHSSLPATAVPQANEQRAQIQAMTRELCERIRDGQADGGEFREAVLAHVERTVVDKLRVANPKFLERVGA